MRAKRKASRKKSPAPRVRILAIDVGGTGLKAAIISADGKLLTERVRIETPHPCTPKLLVESLTGLVAPLGDYRYVSVGFPGVISYGRVVTAPNLGTERFAAFDLAGALRKRLKRPVRVVNDADMQGLGASTGRGVEVTITLGTGFGSGIVYDGRLCPHLELGHHPFRKGETYEEQLGDEARKRAGKKKWNRRVELAIGTLRALTHFDRLYIGGGNAKRLTLEPHPDVRIISNETGVRGGAWLWRDEIA